MPKNESLNGGPGSRVCPIDRPICRNYLANKHWGDCHPDDSGPCCASYCKQSGCPPTGECGNGGLIQKGHDYGQGNKSAVCPSDLPFCADYLVNKHWGKCGSLPDYGKGSTAVVVGQPCADSGNAKGQKLNVPSYVENVFELLGNHEAGHPGEFFIDAGGGFAYYVPHAGEGITTTVGHLPILDHLISATAVSDLEFQVRFYAVCLNEFYAFFVQTLMDLMQGVVFEHTTWMGPSTGVGHVEVQAGFCTVCTKCSCGNRPCVTANCTCVGAETPAAARFSGVTGVTLDSCTFRHIGSNGVSFSGGSHRNTVSRSTFSDISASAVAIGTRSGSVASMTEKQFDINNTVSDCTITDVANEYRGHPGILVGFSHGTTIEHNEVAYVPYTAISLGWGWSGYPHTFDGANSIVANNIHHHMQVLGDGGAIYTLGTQGNMPFLNASTNTSAILSPSMQARNWIHEVLRIAIEMPSFFDSFY